MASPSRERLARTSGAAVEFAVARLRVATALDRARIQSVHDAVAQAAEQVQDKRLDFLKEGPDVTFTDMLPEVFWTVLLESPLAGKLVASAFRRMLTTRLQRSLAAAEAVYAGGQRVARLGLVVPDPVRLESFTARVTARSAELAAQAGRLDRRNAVLQWVVDEGDDYAVALVKAWRAGAQKAPTQAALDPGESPGVLVRTVADRWRRSALLGLEVETAYLEAQLRLGVVDPASIPLPEDARRSDGARTETGLSAHYQIKTRVELVIWVLLMLEAFRTTHHGLNGKRYATTWEQTLSAPTDHLPGGLYEYLLVRMIDPMTGRAFGQVPAMPTAGLASGSYDLRRQHLAQHLMAIGKAIRTHDLADVLVGPSRRGRG